MSQAGPASDSSGLVNRQTAPVFSIFFMWGLGTGALWVVRPLFAAELAEGTAQALFLVGLVSAASAAPRILSGPITGILADRWGRRPLILLAAFGQGTTLVLQFFSQNYLQYILLELVAGLAIATWNVSSNVLVADITKVSNRGRGVALRGMSQRAGMLAGPLLAGIIAATWDLRYAFLFMAATKVVVILITKFLVKETNPERRERREPNAPGHAARPPRARLEWGMFANKAFIALVCATLAYGMIGVGPGVFRTFFPVFLNDNAGLGTTLIGTLMSVAMAVTIAATLPVGVLLDARGRRFPMFTGLVVTAASAYLMAITGSFALALLTVLVFGIAEAFNQGSVQTYAMDLAPPDKRGAFLGIWHVAMNTGQFAGPLGIGLVASLLGMTTAFLIMGAIVAAAALAVLLLAAETRRGTPQAESA